MDVKRSSTEWLPFCLRLNALTSLFLKPSSATNDVTILAEAEISTVKPLI